MADIGYWKADFPTPASYQDHTHHTNGEGVRCSEALESSRIKGGEYNVGLIQDVALKFMPQRRMKRIRALA